MNTPVTLIFARHGPDHILVTPYGVKPMVFILVDER